jgi:hypothetical protein
LRCCCLLAFQCVDADHADRICGECADYCAWGAAQVHQSRTRTPRRGTSFALSLLTDNKISRIACFGEFACCVSVIARRSRTSARYGESPLMTSLSAPHFYNRVLQPANTQSLRPKASPRQPPPGADGARGVGVGGGLPEARSASPIQTPYGFIGGLQPYPGYMSSSGLYGAMPMAGFPGGMQGMNGGVKGESAPNQGKQQQNKASSVWRAPWKASKDQRAQKPAQNGNTAAQAARAGGSGSAVSHAHFMYMHACRKITSCGSVEGGHSRCVASITDLHHV